MDFVFTHRRKSQAVAVMDHFLAMVKTRYNLTVRFIRTDGERTLGTARRSAPRHTPQPKTATPKRLGGTDSEGSRPTYRRKFALEFMARDVYGCWLSK